METIAALVVFSVVSSVTPGPNNLLLWASGAEFGVRRTVRHVLGTSLGIGVMTLGAAAGIAALVAAVPGIAVAMKVLGSIYLLYLAWQIARARGLTHDSIARPLTLREAAAFQAVNPKAWIFALSAITTFRPAGLAIVPGSLLVAGTMAVVIVPTAMVWVVGGGFAGRLLEGRRSHQAVDLALALLLVATVGMVWV